ncbi:MAG TPA: hypothetical protein VJV78_38365 [Polyangiales bacterium]|nr:hypothetical protein [Polyangiales bacterium]
MKRLLRSTQLSHRALVVGLVASAVALQLAGTVHLAVVQHAYCAEHGEAVDVARHAAQDRSEQAAEGVERGQPEAPDSDSHHHCRLDEDRSAQAVLVHAALVGPRAPSPDVVAPPHAPYARATARITQLLAPKTSPPA